MGFVYLVDLPEEIVVVLQVRWKVVDKWRELVVDPFRNIFRWGSLAVADGTSRWFPVTWFLVNLGQEVQTTRFWVLNFQV